MGKSGAKRKQGSAQPVAVRRKGWQRHLDTLGMTTPREYREWCRTQGFASSLHKAWWAREQEAGRAARLAVREETLGAQARHISALGFSGDEAYEAWCAKQGFRVSRYKSEAQRAKEAEVRQKEQTADALARGRQQHDSPQTRILALYANRDEPPRNYWEQRLRLFYERALTRSPGARDAFRDLLLAACRYPGLLAMEPQPYPEALLHLALLYREWQRPLSEWKPKARRSSDLFGSLVRHLLTEYPVPAFMDVVWFQDANPQTRREQEWFLHIGNGGNIRSAPSVPLDLTSMAAHHFLRAPRDLSIIAAMRWGQVMGMRGSRRLAHAVVATRLREVLADEAFWTTVVQFFVNHPSLDSTQVGPIVDYIYHQRFEPMVVVNEDGEEISAAVPNPNFSMKGRTPAALLRQVEAWHRQLADMAKRPARQWGVSGINPLNLTVQSATTGEVTYWATRELLSSKELEEEGRAMNNCVATYVRECLEGESAIWSLRVWTPHDHVPRRVMTIEVCPATRAIAQARGKCNFCASEPHAAPRLKAGIDAVRQWAKQENLTLSPGAW